MKKMYALLFVVFISLFSFSTYSNAIKTPSSNNFINGTNFIEKEIKNKLHPSNLGIHEDSKIVWSNTNDGGATATIVYRNSKVKIIFTQEELTSASQGQLTTSTTNKIGKTLSAQPGGGGPLK